MYYNNITITTIVTFSFVMKETIFNKCSAANGGAIFLDNAALGIKLFDCGFYKCSATSRAGGIMVQKNSYFVSKNVCFDLCEASLSPNFLLWADVHENRDSEVNNTSENDYCTGGHGSCPGGRNRFLFCNNNASNHISTAYAGGWHFLFIPVSISCSYNQLSNNTGRGIISFELNNANQQFSYFNFINNNPSVALITFQLYITHRVVFQNSVFIMKSAIQICGPLSGSGLITLDRCVFNLDIPSNMKSNIQETFCSYAISPISTNHIRLFETKICWQYPITIQIMRKLPKLMILSVFSLISFI